MAEFQPINTQEELDRIIGARIQRERETVTRQFQAQLDESSKKITGYEQQIADLNKAAEGYKGQASRITELETQVKAYETSSVKMKVAREAGLPYELADRLSGDNEADIRKDAEALGKLLQQQNGPAPLYHPSGEGAGKDAALRGLLAQMKGQ